MLQLTAHISYPSFYLTSHITAHSSHLISQLSSHNSHHSSPTDCVAVIWYLIGDCRLRKHGFFKTRNIPLVLSVLCYDKIFNFETVAGWNIKLSNKLSLLRLNTVFLAFTPALSGYLTQHAWFTTPVSQFLIKIICLSVLSNFGKNSQRKTLYWMI